jgi:hypothetical protein
MDGREIRVCCFDCDEFVCGRRRRVFVCDCFVTDSASGTCRTYPFCLLLVAAIKLKLLLASLPT